MLNSVIISLLILSLLNFEISAQQTLKGRFGFGFGYQTGVDFINFSTINKTFLMKNEKGLPNNLITKGFTSYFYFLILPDSRLTLNILSGSKDIQSSTNRYISYEKSYWGLGLEYTFSIGHFNISPGFSAGMITDYVELSTFIGNFNFPEIVNDYNSQIFSSSSINLENRSFHISPVINLEYSLSRFSAICLKYSYHLRLSELWRFLHRFSMENLPENMINNNHYLSLSFLIGFMSK